MRQAFQLKAEAFTKGLLGVNVFRLVSQPALEHGSNTGNKDMSNDFQLRHLSDGLHYFPTTYGICYLWMHFTLRNQRPKTQREYEIRTQRVKDRTHLRGRHNCRNRTGTPDGPDTRQ